LIKAAEWYAQHAAHLDGVTDATTLFLLSADATTEDVREWFMERAAAGDVPTRAEVVEALTGQAQTSDPIATTLPRNSDS